MDIDGGVLQKTSSNFQSTRLCLEAT